MPDEGSRKDTPQPGSSTTAKSVEASKDMAQGVSGFELVASGVIFSLVGVWIDQRLGTTPLFILILASLGFGGSVANIYYRYRREIAFHEAEAEALRKQAGRS